MGNKTYKKITQTFAVKHFITTVLGFAVSLGNVWRFPYLLQKHSPGAFLLPYVLVVLVFGIPLIILEITIGMHFQNNQYNTWQNVHPAFGGIGVASCVVAFVIVVNYNIMLTWLIIYLFSSFRTSLPWTNCTDIHKSDCTEDGPVSYFWNNMISEISSGHIPCGVFMALSWVLVFAVCKYRRDSDEKKWPNGLFSLICLSAAVLFFFVFFVRSLLLDGTLHGFIFLFRPEISGIVNIHIWLDAISQLCYTYGITFGPLISIGRICKCSQTNTYLTSIFIGLWTLFTSILVSILVYGSLGNIAVSNYQNCMSRPGNHSRCSLEKELDLAGDGPGTTLIAFSNISGKFGDFSPVMAVVIFTLFIVIALYTQSETVLTIQEAVVELGLISKYTPFGGILCIAGFIFGTAIVTLSNNMNLFLLLESASFLLPLLVVIECVAIAQIYGLKKLWEDFHVISGTKQNPVLSVLWKWILPIFLCLIVVWNILNFLLGSKSFIHPRHYMAKENDQLIEILTVIIVSAAPLVVAGIYTFQNLPNSSKDTEDFMETNYSNIDQQNQVIQINNYISKSNVIVGDGNIMITDTRTEVDRSEDSEESVDEDEWELLEDGLFV